MRMMRFSNLYLLSMRERRALTVDFSHDVTILKGPNGRGKSAIVKSLYDAFAATPHKIDRSWKSANVSTMVEFTIDDQPFKILKTNDKYSIFDADDRRLLETNSVTSVLSPFLADLLDFRLVLADRDKKTVIPPPAYMFAPFYVDQDQGWTKPWESFVRMYLPDSKRALSNYHTGLRPNSYYIALAQRDRVRSHLSELEEQRNTLRIALEEIRELVADIALNYDIEDFESEINILVSRSSELNRQQESYRDRLTNLTNERALWTEQQALLRSAMTEMRQTVHLAAAQPESIECPTCGQHYDNSLVSRFGLVSQFDDLFDSYQEGEERLRVVEEKLSEARRSLSSIQAQIGQIDDVLDTRRDGTTLGEIISVQGRNETTSLLREKIASLDANIGVALQALKEAESALKRSVDPERSRDIVAFFDACRSQFADQLDVRLDRSAQAITSPQLARGSEGPRGLISYYYAILQTARKYGSSAFCPIVVDAPNQQGQDARHLPEILQFLVDYRPPNAQLIVATEEIFDLSDDDIDIVDVGVDDNQVLEDTPYEEVSNYFRPYLGYLI